MHKPRKRFGQHFLHDKTIIDNILQVFHAEKDQFIIEIGPGKGALTVPLLQQHSPLTVIELDRDVIPHLEQRCAGIGELIIYQQDVLTFDFTKLSTEKPVRLIGNLPYNISTPLLFHLSAQKVVIQDMLFMLQQEIVDRLAASVNTPEYGRLSIMLQYEFMITPVFSVPPQAFAPPPKVNSAIVYFVPRYEEKDQKYGKILDKKIFADIVREAFQYRRKTCRHALGKYFTEKLLQQCDINPQQRPAELTIAHYVSLANLLAVKEGHHV